MNATIEIQESNAMTMNRAIVAVCNFSDKQVDDMRDFAYDTLKSKVPNLTGCSLQFLGECGRFSGCFMVTEASVIGSKKTPRSFLVGRFPDKDGWYQWTVTQIK